MYNYFYSSIELLFVLKNLKYIITLIFAILSINLLVEEQTYIDFFEESTELTHPNLSTDFTESPENEIIQSLRRSTVTKQEIYLRFHSDNPANYIATILELKNTSNYFLFILKKVCKQKKFLHLFQLY